MLDAELDDEALRWSSLRTKAVTCCKRFQNHHKVKKKKNDKIPWIQRMDYVGIVVPLLDEPAKVLDEDPVQFLPLFLLHFIVVFIVVRIVPSGKVEGSQVGPLLVPHAGRVIRHLMDRN